MFKKKAFTLVEILVTLTIFVIVMGLVAGLVVTSFRNFHEGERMLDRNQRQRLCLLRLSREISSLVRMPLPAVSFSGTENSFFFDFAQEDNLVEAGYACNLSASTLERYADGVKQACISDLSVCRFSYSDGEIWKTDWDENTEGVPLMLKINFKVKNETQEREFLVNIPISP